jgi:hypothetical protein
MSFEQLADHPVVLNLQSCANSRLAFPVTGGVRVEHSDPYQYGKLLARKL